MAIMKLQIKIKEKKTSAELPARKAASAAGISIGNTVTNGTFEEADRI